MATHGESKIPPEAILNLKDRLKHGQNVTKILESQLDTAQQNISLLQGQVRLANETLLNLKKHFQETENILSQLLTPEQKANLTSCEVDSKDTDLDATQKHGSVDSTTRSPLPSENSNKSFDDEKNESTKSPYAIQLRQVLDVLDEEPRRTSHHHDVVSKDCSYMECQTPRKRYDECDYGSSSCTSDHYHRKSDDYCKSKHKMNGHLHREESPKGYSRSEGGHIVHSVPYPSHCNDPCCTGSSEHSPSYKIMEKSPGQLHYVSVRSPNHISEKHHERHHGHCGEKCQSHSYVNYAPYGYHVLEGVPHGMNEPMQPQSPSSRRKRSYVPPMQIDEPPHLKYTKVKRIDGSKLTAQKVLQDFTKRHFTSYNPRYDLDLLIVPPPVPASELLAETKNGHKEVPRQTHESFSPSSPATNRSYNKTLIIHENTSPTEKHNGAEAVQNNNNNIALSPNNNNNNDNNNTIFNHNSYKLKMLAPIKEEKHEEARSKLEDHISKLRNESHTNNKRPITPPHYVGNY